MNDALLVLQMGTDTVAVVPVHALSWHRVQLPAGTLRSPRLRSVLEGLLEDVLLDEPSQLHFALQPDPPANAPVWVAVCNKAWLRDALQTLSAQGIVVRKVVPQWAPELADTPAAAENPPDTLWVTGDESATRLVWADTQGVHQVPLHADKPLPQWLSWLADAQLLARLALYAEPAAARRAEQLFHRPATVVTLGGPLPVTAGAQWDLAQFDLALRHPWLNRAASAVASFAGGPQWRPARWALVVVVLAQLIGLNAYAWRARSILEGQRTDIRQTFSATFPQVAVVVDAPLQMQRELALLRQGAGQTLPRDLESLLAAYAIARPTAATGASQTAMEFTTNALRITGNVPEGEALTGLQNSLQAQGFRATVDGSVLVIQAEATP